MCTRLLEAVAFLHAHGVVHRDLKPENVVIDVDLLRLFIIDYDLATWVYGRDEVLHGFVGTNGFTAPEVGSSKQKGRYYSPIAADLWATGNILCFMMSRIAELDSPELKRLRLISGLLMDDDAKQRPSAKEALTMLLGGTTSNPPLPVLGNAGGLPSVPAMLAVHWTYCSAIVYCTWWSTLQSCYKGISIPKPSNIAEAVENTKRPVWTIRDPSTWCRYAYLVWLWVRYGTTPAAETGQCASINKSFNRNIKNNKEKLTLRAVSRGALA